MLAVLLTDEARRLYASLLGSDGSPRGGPPQGRAYDAPLAELLSQGLVWEHAGPPRRFQPVPPAAAARRLLASHHRRLARLHAELAEQYHRLDRLDTEARAPGIGGPAPSPGRSAPSAGNRVVAVGDRAWQRRPTPLPDATRDPPANRRQPAPPGDTCAPPDAPTPVQLQILRLAATGLKDEAIARQLGRSSRWVRRHIETLEQRLGASNRLTLGIAAARHGWV